MEMAAVQGNGSLVNALESEIALYRARSPLRETSPTN
jgi:hypothetical protein